MQAQQQAQQQIAQRAAESRALRQFQTAQLQESSRARQGQEQLGTQSLNLQSQLGSQDLALREALGRAGISLEERLGLEQLSNQRQTAALQNPFAFAAVNALGGFPGSLGTGETQINPDNPFIPGLAPLGFQLPTDAAVGANISPQQFFPGGIPTAGAIGQISPSSSSFLQDILGFTGTSTPDFASLIASITPGTSRQSRTTAPFANTQRR